jgi:environmental stress-induced protein Ves
MNQRMPQSGRGMMPKFEPGEAVAVSADMQPGAFPGEYLVTVPTVGGPVSGFVRDQDIVDANKTIQAVVRESTASGLSVQLSGSYFTTNGLAELPVEWAKQNVKAIA